MEAAAKIFAIGNSNAVRIPLLMMKSLSWRAKDRVTVRLDEDNHQLVISKASRKRGYPSLQELFSGYNGDYCAQEFAPNDRQGRELI